MADFKKPITKRYLQTYGALYGDASCPAPLKPKKKRTYPERDLVHLPIMRWASRNPICAKYLIHIANERKTTIAQGAMLKMMGVRSGVSDLFLAYPTRQYAGYWIELKAPGGRLTELQREWLLLMMSVGYRCDVFDNKDDAILAIERYLLNDGSGKNTVI